MNATTKLGLTAPFLLGLIIAGCGGDDEATADAATDAPTSAAEAIDEPSTEEAVDETTAAGAQTAVITLGDEAIAITSALCYFEEQPRAGLGGVFTHVAQASGVDAAGEPVLLDLSRARAEDGTVEDDIIVDIGEPGSDEAVSLSASGPEGLIGFGDSSATVESVEVVEFGADPIVLSANVACS